MTTDGKRQHCVVCAWRATCAKKFSVPDGGARCPDFSRDVSIKETETDDKSEKSEGKGE
ncbi:hypothetical protein OR1_00022 [Geobacter sp. OR-1]|uniref:hypothetical protein n=1 Tax=Geobacter sp. OR-1 TaxID=1266765 RepID=UPI000543F320|nr:hypothetical protein [Geobacter sp. OR-1]GAM07753.1 hypothetical protein OR1_00022 [Geobacter sp. OR-1]